MEAARVELVNIITVAAAEAPKKVEDILTALLQETQEMRQEMKVSLTETPPNSI